MANRGPFFIAICSALLVTARALQCYSKVECSPSGPTCDSLTPSSSNLPMIIKDCDSEVTTCSLFTAVSAQEFSLEMAVAGCTTEQQGVTVTNGCYADREDIEKLIPGEAEKLKELEKKSGVTFSNVEVCICDGNFCNGSIKSALSISVIIISVIMSLMIYI